MSTGGTTTIRLLNDPSIPDAVLPSAKEAYSSIGLYERLVNYLASDVPAWIDLAYMLLVGAIQDLNSRRDWSDRHNRYHYLGVMAWINGANAPFPFEMACELLRLDPDAVREAITRRYAPINVPHNALPAKCMCGADLTSRHKNGKCRECHRLDLMRESHLKKTAKSTAHANVTGSVQFMKGEISCLQIPLSIITAVSAASAEDTQ